MKGFEDTTDRIRREKGRHVFTNLRIYMFRVSSNIMHNLLDIPFACFRRSITAWEGFVVLSNRIASKSRFNRIRVKTKPLYSFRDRNAVFARSDNRSSVYRL
jgi:hypothetical protein